MVFVVLVIGLLPSCLFAQHDGKKYVDAFFDSDDPFVRDVVLPNIDKHRKGDLTIRISGLADNESLKDAEVSLKLVRHQFHFGASPTRMMISDQRLEKKFFDVFQYGVSENFFKWSSIERKEGERDFAKADAMVEIFKSRSRPLELHFATGYYPEWFPEKSAAERTRIQREHALDMVERYHDQVAYIQVYNEIWHTRIERASVYFDPTEFFAELTTKYPKTKFGVSDCWRFLEPLPDPQEVKRRYPGISFLAMHAHQPRRLWASSKQIYDCFDPFIDAGIGVHITEFGIRPGTIEGTEREGVWNDELAAEYFVVAATTAFSHPVPTAFNFWSNGPEENLSFSVNRMFNADGTTTPAYAALDELINHKLTTELKVKADSEGAIAFRGFYGTYAVSMTATDGKTKTAYVYLSPNRAEREVEFQK